MRRRALLTLHVALCVACSNSDPAPASGGTGGASSSTTVSASGGFSPTGGGGSAGDGCPDSAKAVYLMAKDRTLLRFDPPSLGLETVGKVNCPVNGGPAIPTPTPRSMAVDRSATGWVSYSDGTLFEVDLDTASCKPTDYETGQLTAFARFGMGFASDTAGGVAETLYLSSHDPGDGLASLDFSNFGISRVGYYQNLSGPAELTGTGDGKLYGFFLTDPVVVAELDKGNARESAVTELPQIDIGTSWAFAFWGDDFYMFTAPDGISSKVDRMPRGTSQTTTVLGDVGHLIVGAGVSTCAPVAPPK